MSLNLRLIIISFIGLVIILWVLNLSLVPRIFGWPNEAGPFGDMFGALNALFSGLAFAGLIIAILLQREELKLQRQTLTEQLNVS
jgi:hypothetical protein